MLRSTLRAVALVRGLVPASVARHASSPRSPPQTRRATDQGDAKNALNVTIRRHDTRRRRWLLRVTLRLVYSSCAADFPFETVERHRNHLTLRRDVVLDVLRQRKALIRNDNPDRQR
jgi:hypothetical protein